MEFSGKITYISQVEKVGEKEVEKMTICIRESGDVQYPQSLAVDIMGEKVANFKPKLKVDQEVTAYLNTKYRRWEKDWKTSVFNGITAWRIDVHSGDSGKTTTDIADEEELPF